MSFSYDIKEELSNLKNIKNKEQEIRRILSNLLTR